MRDTTITIQRPANGQMTQVATGIRCQVDQASTKEVVEHRQAYAWEVADYFKVYTTDWNPTALIRRGDELVDERATDPETGQPFRYRVMGRVKDYEYSHQEMFCRVLVGS